MTFNPPNISFDRFVWSRSVCADARLTAAAKCVLWALVGRADATGEAFPSIDRLAEDSATSRGTVKRAIRSAAGVGYLRIEARDGRPNVYQLRLAPPAKIQGGIASDPPGGSPVTRIAGDPGISSDPGGGSPVIRGGITSDPQTDQEQINEQITSSSKEEVDRESEREASAEAMLAALDRPIGQPLYRLPEGARVVPEYDRLPQDECRAALARLRIAPPTMALLRQTLFRSQLRALFAELETKTSPAGWLRAKNGEGVSVLDDIKAGRYIGPGATRQSLDYCWQCIDEREPGEPGYVEVPQ